MPASSKVEQIEKSSAIPMVPVSASMIDDASQFSMFGQPQPYYDFDNLYVWLHSSPELMEVVGNMTHDVWGEGYDLVGTDENIKRATEFSLRNNFKKNAFAWTFDAFLTGNSYFGVSRISKGRIKQIIQEVRTNQLKKSGDYGSDYFDLEAYAKIRKQDPTLFQPQRLFVIKSGSIKINYAPIGGEIISYIQQASQKFTPVAFSPEEIIHLSINNVGDAIYGLSSAIVSMMEIETIYAATKYARKFFQNDATPNFIFKLPNDAPRSPNFINLQEQLKSYRNNPHKHLLLTGNVEVDRVNPFNKDMEFRQLIRELTGIYKRSYGYPSDETEKNPLIHERYFRRINFVQDLIQDLLNSRLWNEFEVEMRFRRIYKRDESREADIVNKLTGRPVITVNEGRKYLGYDPTNNPEDDVVGTILPSPNPTGANQPTVPKSEAEAADNRTEQANAPEEMMVAFERVAKMIKDQNLRKGGTLTIPWDYFLAIVEKFTPFNRAKIFYLETMEDFVLLFSDGLYKYRTSVPKASLVNLEEFKSSYLANAVPFKGEV